VSEPPATLPPATVSPAVTEPPATAPAVPGRPAASGRHRDWPVWWTRLRSTIFLAALTASVASTSPSVGAPGAVLLGLAAVGWLSWSFGPALRRAYGARLPDWLGRPDGGAALNVAGVLVVGLAGLALSALQSPGPAIGFLAAACLNAGLRIPFRVSVPVASGLAAGWVIVHLPLGSGAGWVLAGPGVCLFALMAGLIRRQNESLTEETRLAREEQARSAALAERARIAREIHDVLAHSLAALTVQLETADALLEGGRAEQARQSVVRAGQLAREGLAETRRAIGALRGETLPLPELLAGLAGGYRTDLSAPAAVRVEGEPRELSPDTALAVYRTAQEAMTNVRKHAPGAPVELALRYRPGAVELAVANGTPPPSGRPLAGSGGGYGLTGLRERAELAGGEFTAGPDGDGWRVDVRIPL
jgi:signal transduction histidine kinase